MGRIFVQHRGGSCDGSELPEPIPTKVMDRKTSRQPSLFLRRPLLSPPMSPRALPLLIVLALLAGASSASAHPALYHYLEINLHQPGQVTVYVTVHAPELSDEVAPLEEDVFGAEWLASLDDATIAGLVANAERFGDEKFAFSFGERSAELALDFPDADVIRLPAADTEVPAGCFSGVASLAYAPGENTLTLQFADTADKRLMLVINRPAAFPEVFDIEPGTAREIQLPPAPEIRRFAWSKAHVSAIAAAIVGIAVLLVIRRRRT